MKGRGSKAMSGNCWSVDDVFVWLEGETAWRFSPPRQLNVHTQRDARKGRATEEKGAI
jgi:hypothetical protein